jgi:hypothetical protein
LCSVLSTRKAFDARPISPATPAAGAFARSGISLPAIEGGTPVRAKLLPYGHQWLDDADIAVPVAAVAPGACIIEKHFTLSHAIPGPDSDYLARAERVQAMVDAVRVTEKAPGEERYEVTEREGASRAFRRPRFFVEDMGAGDVIIDEKSTRSDQGAVWSPDTRRESWTVALPVKTLAVRRHRATRPTCVARRGSVVLRLRPSTRVKVTA